MKAKTALLAALFALVATLAQAKLIGPEGLMGLVLGQYDNVKQFQVELTNRVYDPEALASLESPLGSSNLASELPQRSFKQEVLFIRDEFIGIKALDLKGRLLHLSIEQNGGQQEKSLDPKRPFARQDLDFLGALAVTKNTAAFKSRLNRLGLAPTEVAIERQGERMLYRLGGLKENLLIDPMTYKIIAINRLVSIDGRDFILSVHFIGQHPQSKSLPRRIDYQINGRLFKSVTLGKFSNQNLTKVRSLWLKQLASNQEGHAPFTA